MDNKEEIILICEKALKDHKNYCEEHSIYPRWSEWVERFLSRQNEVSDAYLDLSTNSGFCYHQAQVFFDALLCARTAWSPDDAAQYRASEKRLSEVNHQIASLAADLADLIRERSQIENTNPLHSDTHYSVVKVMKAAAAKNYHFTSYVEDPLSALSQQYDWKYWPTIEEMIDEVSTDASKATIEITDEVSAAAMSSSRGSKADFVRALLARVQNEVGGLLPHSFHLKDDSWASFVNVLLDLGPDHLVDGPYIKRLRQKARAFTN